MSYRRYDASRLLRAEIRSGVHGTKPAQITSLFTYPDRLTAAMTCEFWAAKAVELGGEDDPMALDLFRDAERILAGENVEPWMTPKEAA